MAENGLYDVVSVYQQIEDELITSMTRTMRKHIGDEMDEGINWTQWQAEMLKGLQEYRAGNADKLDGYVSSIDDKIDKAIREAYATGESEQEIEILRRLKGTAKADKTGPGTDAMRGSFFKINDAKLNALIKATTEDFNKANSAILRRSEDAYRQIIFSAQTFYNTGASSLWQAVDRASKDFLSQGINCIQYKNGARVNIVSYSEMALRTAGKRANLMGAGNKRSEYGLKLVKVNAKGTACPMCLPFLGNVFIDDVYSGGQRGDASYPLLSSAVDAGLFHPNCKDGLSTYYPGVSRPPQSLTDEQKDEAIRRYTLEQQQRTCERNIRKYTRLANGAIDEGNAAAYTAKKQQWTQKYSKLVRSNGDVLRSDPTRLRLYGLDKVNESTFNTPISKYKGGKAAEKKIIADLTTTTTKLKASMLPDDYDAYIKLVQGNDDITRLYKYADGANDVISSNKGVFAPAENKVYYNYPLQKYINDGMSKYSVLAHEYGHFFDTCADKAKGLQWMEIDKIKTSLKYPPRAMKEHLISNSDEFLAAMRKDMASIKANFDAVKQACSGKGENVTTGIQDAIDGFSFGRIGWGHGDKYYNRMYSYIKTFDKYASGEKQTVTLQKVYKSLGLDASNQLKTKTIARNYDTASELWANIVSAETCGGEELENIKKYMPESYKTMKKILGGLE